MQYYFTVNKSFYSIVGRSLLLPSLFGLGCLLRINSHYESHITIDYILLSFFALFLILGLLKVSKLLSCIIFKKPVLFANEFYIDNLLDNRKYYWDDIEEVIPGDNYLKINLHETQNHPVKRYAFLSHNLANGYSRKSKGKISFYIYVGALNVNENEFLETLNNYSIVAESKK